MSKYQNQTSVDVHYARESEWGVVPSTGWKATNRVSWNATEQAQSYTSKRIRKDRQVEFLRLGTRMVQGTFEDELSIGGSDDWLAASVCGFWMAGATFTGLVTTAGSGMNSITRATGSWILDRFNVGDVVTLSGLATSSSNGTARIVTVTETTIGVDRALADETNVSVTVTVNGKKLTNGTVDQSFSAELQLTDLYTATYIVQSGLKVTGASINLAPNGIITTSYDVIGKGENAPSLLSASNAVSENQSGDLLVSPDALVYLNGQRVELLTTLDFKFNNNANSREVIGSRSLGNISLGRFEAMMNFDVLMTDTDLIADFSEETPIHLSIYLRASNDTDFLQFTMPYVKLMSLRKDFSGEQEVILSISAQALRDPVTTKTVIIQSTAAL